jgi:hypothetical protein
MAEPKCAACAFRARYDKKPASILGRLWRWHINWCPGWKSYMKSLAGDEKANIITQYKLKT